MLPTTLQLPKITFILNLYQDQQVAQALYNQLLTYYPTNPIVLIGDGVDVALPSAPNVTKIRCDRAKHRPTGYWTHRYLHLALQTESTYLIKLDPDARLWRSFALPDAAWFGTPGEPPSFIRGGAMGLRCDEAAQIVESGLLLNRTPYVYDSKGESLPNQDRTLGHVCHRLKIQPTNWPEVFIQPAGPSPAREHYAITHPHVT